MNSKKTKFFYIDTDEVTKKYAPTMGHDGFHLVNAKQYREYWKCIVDQLRYV